MRAYCRPNFYVADFFLAIPAFLPRTSGLVLPVDAVHAKRPASLRDVSGAADEALALRKARESGAAKVFSAGAAPD